MNKNTLLHNVLRFTTSDMGDLCRLLSAGAEMDIPKSWLAQLHTVRLKVQDLLEEANKIRVKMLMAYEDPNFLQREKEHEIISIEAATKEAYLLGGNINAIKTYRCLTGEGPRESKNYVDSMIPEWTKEVQSH